MHGRKHGRMERPGTLRVHVHNGDGGKKKEKRKNVVRGLSRRVKGDRLCARPVRGIKGRL